jgi:hypothetical protein
VEREIVELVIQKIKIPKPIFRGPADNVLFDLSGGVYDPETLESLGSLTEGGAE